MSGATSYVDLGAVQRKEGGGGVAQTSYVDIGAAQRQEASADIILFGAAPLVQQRKEWPFSANTTVNNLLTTTLAVVVSAPFIVNQFTTVQHPSHRLTLNADTTQDTPKTLTADRQLPVQDYQHTPPDRVRPVTDTSRGTPKTLTADAQLPAQDYQHTAPDRVRPVADTSKGSWLTQFAITPAPLFNPPWSQVDRLRPVTDTSRGTPKTLTADSQPPVFNYQHTAPDRVRPVWNTSQSSAGLFIPINPLPVGQSTPQSLLQNHYAIKSVVNTTYGTPIPLLPIPVVVVVAPALTPPPYNAPFDIRAGVATGQVQGVSGTGALPSQKAVNPLKPNYSWIQWVNSLYLVVRNFSFAGNKDASDAATGNVGEFVAATVATPGAITLASATPATVTSISLTAGDWELVGQVDFLLTGASATLWQAGVSLVSATLAPQTGGGAGLGTDPTTALPLATTALSSALGLLTKGTRLNVAVDTVVYLVAQANFSAGAVAAYGTVTARRMR